jgi:hypothetical protein
LPLCPVVWLSATPREIGGFVLGLADPEEICVHHQGGSSGIEQLHPARQSAARIHQALTLVGNDDLKSFDGRQMSLHLVGMMVDIDHHGRHAGFLQRIERIIDHRLAADLHQGFGRRLGYGSHPRAETGREYHGLGDGHVAYAADSGSSIPASAHQLRKGARTGCSNATDKCQSVLGM